MSERVAALFPCFSLTLLTHSQPRLLLLILITSLGIPSCAVSHLMHARRSAALGTRTDDAIHALLWIKGSGSVCREGDKCLPILRRRRRTIACTLSLTLLMLTQPLDADACVCERVRVGEKEQTRAPL